VAFSRRFPDNALQFAVDTPGLPSFDIMQARSALVVIPARGGSKGIPGKNLQTVGGLTLVGRAVRTARAAITVGRVVVSTDDPAIAQEARRHGADVVERPAELSGDTASSESAVLHALDALADDPEITVLLQCTSPFVDPADLDAAITAVAEAVHDVVVAVTPTHDFQWTLDGDTVRPVGHSIDNRPRRQERAPHFRETGAFYAMRTAGLRTAGTRFFGDIGIRPVDPDTSLEIDEPGDLERARRLAAAQPQRLTGVEAIVTDFDGVHTDDHAYVDAAGVEQVRVHRGDGLGVAAIRRERIPFLILSKERNAVVAARATKLGVDVLQGIDDKAAALKEWAADNHIDLANTVYVGNDVNDLPALALVGRPVAVADARPEVLAAAQLILTRRGGDGAVRELCDMVLAGRATRPGRTTS